MDINDVEVAIAKEITGASSAYFPFGWITKRGAFIQDVPMEPGYRRINEIIAKYDLKMSPEDFLKYWIRVDGCLINANTNLTKNQIGGLQEYMAEFPHLYGRKKSRAHFISKEYEIIHNENGVSVREK